MSDPIEPRPPLRPVAPDERASGPAPTPPPDFERCLLARLCSADEFALAWNKGLRTEYFLEPLNQAVFKWIHDYWSESGQTAVPTPAVLAQEFGRALKLPADSEEAGTTVWLVEHLRRRHVWTLGGAILRAAISTIDDDPEGTLRKMRSDLEAVADTTVERCTEINMADTIEEREQRYARRAEKPEGLGATYGLPELDRHTGGCMPGELTVVGASAKTGKSWFLANAAVGAVFKGLRPVVFTLEMSLAAIQDRVDAIMSGVCYDRLSKGRLSEDELEELRAARRLLASMGGLMIKRPERGERTPANLCARTRHSGGDYLIIDQLSHMEAGHTTQNRKEQYASILSRLHDEIARGGRELPCLLAVQTRRNEPELTKESFADAAEVEREADLLLGLHRTGAEKRNNQMKLHILAARNADDGSDLSDFMLHWRLVERTEISVARIGIQ